MITLAREQAPSFHPNPNCGRKTTHWLASRSQTNKKAMNETQANRRPGRSKDEDHDAEEEEKLRLKSNLTFWMISQRGNVLGHSRRQAFCLLILCFFFFSSSFFFFFKLKLENEAARKEKAADEGEKEEEKEN